MLSLRTRGGVCPNIHATKPVHCWKGARVDMGLQRSVSFAQPSSRAALLSLFTRIEPIIHESISRGCRGQKKPRTLIVGLLHKDSSMHTHTSAQFSIYLEPISFSSHTEISPCVIRQPVRRPKSKKLPNERSRIENWKVLPHRRTPKHGTERQRMLLGNPR